MQVEHRGSKDLGTRAEAILEGLYSAVLKFSYANGLFSKLETGQGELLPNRTLTWGSPIQKYITIRVDDLQILTFQVEVRAFLNDYGRRSRKSQIIASRLDSETLKAGITDYLDSALELGNSWSKGDLEYVSESGY